MPLELGTVEHFHPREGYGFLRCDRESPSFLHKETELVYFHISDISNQWMEPRIGDTIGFSLDTRSVQPKVAKGARIVARAELTRSQHNVHKPNPVRQKAVGSHPNARNDVKRSSAEDIRAPRRLQVESISSDVESGVVRHVLVDLDSFWTSFVDAQHVVCRFPGASKTRDLEVNLEGFTRRLAHDRQDDCTLRLVAFYFRTPDAIADKLRGTSLNGVTWEVSKVASVTSSLLDALSDPNLQDLNQRKTLVLVPGDDKTTVFRWILDKYIRNGWFVEIHAWLSTIPAGYTEYQRENPDSVVIAPLDDDNIGDILRPRGTNTAARKGTSSALGCFARGIVDHFDEKRGFGFIRRVTSSNPASQVFFRKRVVSGTDSTPLQCGDTVLFTERMHRKKGPQATEVRRQETLHEQFHEAARSGERDSDAFIPGVVTGYTTVDGFGSIAKLDGSNVSLSFHIADCDIKRPPLKPGEHVMVQEAVGPKGPRARSVRRVSMTPDASLSSQSRSVLGQKPKTASKKKAPKKSEVPAMSTSDLSALMRVVMSMANMVDAPKVPQARQNENPWTPPPSIQQILPAQYRAMIQNLSSPSDGALYVPAGLALLARTRPRDARRLEAVPDDQSTRLIIELAKELDDALHQENLDQRDAIENASLLNFGYVNLPPPVEPEPELEPAPRTVYCHVCMDDHPVEDMLVIRGCNHGYCRESIRRYLVEKIERKDACTTCPLDDCHTMISDVDMKMVLTPEEVDEYYNVSMAAAVNDESTLFMCIEQNCRGVAALPPDNPHFRCPLCAAERCVACNTVNWEEHDGLTCAQVRQRGLDSGLSVKQLRDLYGHKAYQCAQCSFGPIEHSHCDSLIQHHNDVVGNARINNACPMCGWFAQDIAEWPRWDGTMRVNP